MKRVISLILTAIIMISCIQNNSDLKHVYAADTVKPTAPTNLVASNIKETTLQLNWTASTDNVKVSKYLIYRGSTNILTVTGTTCTITGLRKNTSYSFYVIAVDSSNNKSSRSSTLTIKTAIDSTLPTTPTGLASSGIGMNNLTLSWQKSTDVSGIKRYNIYENGVSKYTSTTNSIAITELTMNTGYAYQIEAVDTYNNVSAKSTSLTVTTAKDTQAPSQPMGLVASNVTEDSLDLNWSASTDNIAVSKYLIYQGSTVIQTVTGTNCTITDLMKDTSFSFYVQAVDSNDNKSINSTVLTVKTLMDSTAPTIPTNVVTTNV